MFLSDLYNKRNVNENISPIDLAELLFNAVLKNFPEAITRYGHEVVGDAVLDYAEEATDLRSMSDIDIAAQEILDDLANYQGDRTNELEPEKNNAISENLRKWFKEKWVRFGPDGKIRGACARGDDSEGKPKCLPQSKAHALGKAGRASAAARKRRQDPNPERSGAAINVATKKKSNEGVAEGFSVVKSDYDLDQMVLTFDIEGPRKGKPLQFTYWDYDEDFANAERRDVFDQLQQQSWYAGLDHPTKMEILDASYKAIRGEEPSEYKPTVDDEPLDEQGVSEGSLDELHADMSNVYNKLAPGIEKYKDKSGADKLYQSLFSVAQQHGASAIFEFKRMLNNARNSAHMDYDTNPGGFENWFWYLPFADDEQGVAEGLQQTLRKIVPGYAKREIDKKMDTGKFGKTDADKDANFYRYKKIQDKIKGQGIVEEKCPHCGGPSFNNLILAEKQDACYHKVKSRYKVWPSAYASGALVQCRKKGAANWGKKKTNETKQPSLDSDTVKRLQNYLNIKFGANLDVDGVLGNLTKKSIKKFMKKTKTKLAPEPDRTTAVQGKTKKVNETRFYFYPKATDASTLVNEFKLTKDNQGWYLTESQGPAAVLEAQRAFGIPKIKEVKLKEFNLAAFSGSAAIKGDDNVLSPIGSKALKGRKHA